MTVLNFLNAAGFTEQEGSHATLGATFCFMVWEAYALDVHNEDK